MYSFERWSSLCRTINARTRVRDSYALLVLSYQEPDRVYHNLRHIADCLDEFDTVRYLADSPAAVEAAIWFHDVVCNPQASQNEERSAELAGKTLTDMGVSDDFCRAVQALILLTKHDIVPATVDGQIVVDVDLSILGKSQDIFDAYESRVRQEFFWMSNHEFWPKRRSFLLALLARKHIFNLDPFVNKYELAARTNLQRSIERIARLNRATR